MEFADLPAGGDHVLELWLSNCGPQRIRTLEIEAGANCAVVRDTRPRWITHGSSITHSKGLDANQFPGLAYGTGSAHSPSRTWPATAAKLADVNLLSLGFGGQCHMDQMMARQIRDTPADCISLKFGINVHTMGSMVKRAFAQAALGFIQTVREGHPTTPLLLVSPIYGHHREEKTQSTVPFLPLQGNPDARFPTLRDMRAELKRLVEILQSRRDSNIKYLDGLELFGEAEGGMMPDRLHPNGDGYELIGRRFAALAFGPEGKLLPGKAASRSAAL